MHEQTLKRSLQRVSKYCSDFVRSEEPLGPRTTWRIGGPARLFAQPRRLSELKKLLDILRSEELPWFFLGLGSNVLISDDGFPGVVIQPQSEFKDTRLEGNDIVVGPMARLFDVTVFAAHHSLSGLERLCGIPGSVGGGLYMNAGAYSSNISDKLEHLELLEPDGEIQILKRSEIDFSYRIVPRLQKGIILHSRFSLVQQAPQLIWAEMRETWKMRRSSQPLEFPSAGSVFKRPKEDFAGRLVEAAGAKGLRIGDAIVSKKHANFFINIGHATATDMVALIRRVRTLVLEKFGVQLELEVKPIGFPQNPFAIAP